MTEAPPPHDPVLAAMLEETKRDNQQDDRRAQQFLDAAGHATAVKLAGQSKEDARHAKLLEALAAGPTRTKRDTFEAWLAAMPKSTSITEARKLCIDRWALLNELAP